MTRRRTVTTDQVDRTRSRQGAALLAMLALAACSSGSTAGASTSTPSPSVTVVVSTPVAATSSAASIASAVAPASSGPPQAASIAPLEGTGVTLYFESTETPDASAQTELVTASGRHIYIDLENSQVVAAKPTARDVLLITHYHPDHEDPNLIDRFTGQKMVAASGSISLPDVRITGIPAAHTEGDAITDKDASDYIFLVEVGGVRIAHFGDLGEKALTASQMEALGRVDVAISQLQNPYSDMDEGSRLGFDQMHQVNPRIFIPTHLWGSEATARAAAKEWPALVSTGPLHLKAQTMPATTTVVFMGLNAEQFGKLLKLKAASW